MINRAAASALVLMLTATSAAAAPMRVALLVDDRFMKKAADHAPVFVILTGDGSENSKDVDEQGFNRWMAEIAKRGVAVSAVVLKTTGNGLPDFIASTLVKATRGHYTSLSNGGGMAETMTTLAAQLAADAARGR